jgi:hypothetical protein
MKSSVLATLLIATSIALVIAQPAGAIVAGQVDDFEDGTTQGWAEGVFSPNPPTNVPNGGPAGIGDSYLQNISSGAVGAGSRQVTFNRVQWTGDYVAAGVSDIQAQMANFGAGALSMRVAIEGAIGDRFGSTISVALPADGVWRSVTLSLAPADLSLVGGVSNVNTVLANVSTLRILSAAAAPSWQGDAIVSTLGMDNLTAGPAPVPPAPVPAFSGWGPVAVLALLLVASAWRVLSRLGPRAPS